MVRSIGTSFALIGFTLVLGLPVEAQKNQRKIDEFFTPRSGPKVIVTLKPKKVRRKNPPLTQEENDRLRYVLGMNGITTKRKPLTPFEEAYINKFN